ncbi:MAG: cobyrinate a,c-diamide synthase [Deltaproteobacteria bacterium]|nr:cobyrinate a,c-diamide synthase [Deltaproteobacteria bacterium]MBW2660435.1 cobyrinate a,c-diamide synthase [Deltaproteobacteria bacterium]
MNIPRIIIAALRGGAGKTILSIGIIAAWAILGKRVAPFKKGPDYIDAGWLALAAGRPCYNLDTFMIKKEQALNSFLSHSINKDIAVIEGNRGLYDGLDIEGSTSTAELAKLLNAPVVLCIDCTKTTRTMAAVVAGCIKFDPNIKIKGVILNRTAGPRHENILRKSIEYYCGISVLGAVPKLGKQSFPERHMGLIPTPEHTWANNSIETASQMASKYLDLDAIEKIANESAKSTSNKQPAQRSSKLKATSSRQRTTSNKQQAPRIGIIKDSAFQFYYPENIEALISLGAETVFISPLASDSIPPVDALYIGGGFPETHAEELTQNVKFRQELKALAENGLPIYAECGGLMYLGEELVLAGKSYPMAGVLPIVFGLSKKPQGHGYTIITVERENPYYEVGTEIRGHEFHYSLVLKWLGNDNDLVFNMKRGTGFVNKRDGICYKNVFATYTHIHALGTPSWAEALVNNAIIYGERSRNAEIGKQVTL